MRLHRKSFVSQTVDLQSLLELGDRSNRRSLWALGQRLGG